MEWWNRGEGTLSDSKNFLNIIDFYLFNCPIDKKSAACLISVRNKTFKKLKITGKVLRLLLSDMKKSIEYYETVKANDNVEDRVRMIERSGRFKDKDFQLVVFNENTELGKTKTIFYAIRNALAHGAFSFRTIGKDKIYFFENKYKEKVKAQIRIKESTLFTWIKLVEKYSK